MLNATIRAIKDKATELYQTSQDGEIRFTKKGDIRDHQGDDYSLRGNLGAIIHRSDREAIVISVNREYGTVSKHHPDSSEENKNQVTIAYPARLEDKELAGIYVTTYRHMNRIPNNLNVGDTLTGGEILGDYRIIVAESLVEEVKNKESIEIPLGEYRDIPLGEKTYRIIKGGYCVGVGIISPHTTQGTRGKSPRFVRLTSSGGIIKGGYCGGSGAHRYHAVAIPHPPLL